MQVTAATFGQNVTLKQSNVSIARLFYEIRKQTGFDVMIEDAKLKTDKRINADFTNTPLAKVMDQIVAGTNLSYSMEDKRVIIKEKAPSFLDNLITRFAAIDVRGRVVNKEGNGLAGATIALKNGKQSTTSGSDGGFVLRNVEEGAMLTVSFIGYKTQEVSARENLGNLILQESIGELEQVNVMSTGYQMLPKERVTGSFSQVSQEMLNRSVTTNILDRIENLVPGVQFNKGEAVRTDPLLIRGRSTIFADAKPLIVLNNFPYDGDLSNINPNDIADITILKDAAAASIWGAKAGNGVIVITTKKGTTSKPKVEFNSNTTIQEKPDLYNVNTISSADYIELEKDLFTKGYYTGDEQNNSSGMGAPPFTPVIELLIAKRDGIVSQSVADAQIEKMKQYDIRKDTERYLYRTLINQQHSLNVSGSSPAINYYLSAGYDKNLYSLIGQSYNRFSLRSKNTFQVNKKINIDVGVNFVLSSNISGNNPGYNSLISINGGSASHQLYPYARLVNDDGVPQPIYANYNKKFLQSAENKGLLNWEYVPINDINEVENKSKVRDYLLNVGTKYQLAKFLSADFRYQFQNQVTDGGYWYKENSYYARNMINNYTQVNPLNNVLSFPIPRGGIRDIMNSELTAHQGRAQVNYSQNFKQIHEISAISGFEIRHTLTKGNTSRVYGYNPNESLVASTMDFVSQYKLYSNNFVPPQRIENPASVFKRTDNFLSYFANASYAYDNRYIVTASARKDEANLFGVAINKKGTPLWSTGVAWIASNETFLKASQWKYLKVRSSYGENGNISRRASAASTASLTFSSANSLQAMTILTPPNESLSWERIKMLNLGVDFQAYFLSGSIDYYQKRSDNLLGQAPLDPTLGLSSQALQSFFYGNVAGIKGNGVDLELTSININRSLRWRTTLLFSKAKSTVKKYLMPVSSIGNIYMNNDIANINPVEGKPLFSVYSFAWEGIDSENGDPRGRLNNQQSKDWNGIYSNTKLDELVFHGSVQPVTYGAVRNSFEWRNLSLSFNISYKMDYYFRKSAINYGNLLYSWNGSGDFKNRWQQKGQETNIPSFVEPYNPNRDRFYSLASINVLKGDHIRFEDVSVGYEMDRQKIKALPVRNVRFYIYASNLGLIWNSNNENIDPYYNNAPRPRNSCAFGVNINL